VTSFDARLRLPGKTRIPLSVVVDISDERMVLSSGKENLGEFDLHGIKVESGSDGFHLTLDQEEIILSVADPIGFARELGMTPPVDSGGSRRVDTSKAGEKGTGNGSAISRRLESIDLDFDDVRGRISILEAALTNDTVPAAEFFAQWLRLLKEINRRHGQGAIPSPTFYRLNSELLDLMPAPENSPPPQVVESRERASQPGPA
jgi:hypothetical protein